MNIIGIPLHFWKAILSSKTRNDEQLYRAKQSQAEQIVTLLRGCIFGFRPRARPSPWRSNGNKTLLLFLNSLRELPAPYKTDSAVLNSLRGVEPLRCRDGTTPARRGPLSSPTASTCCRSGFFPASPTRSAGSCGRGRHWTNCAESGH